jgi:thermitase
MILKGLDNVNSGYYSWWASAIYYAVDNGAKVINMSVGGSSQSTTLSNAINYAIDNDVVVVACMMNINSSANFFPARYEGVIAVGATNPDDTRSNPFFWSATSGSNFGSHISVIAPGNYTYGLSHTSNTNYGSYWGGTSQAAPHVSGVVSLLLAQDPTRTPIQIKQILELTADDEVGNPLEDTQGWDKYYGYGRVNAFRALSPIVPTGINSDLQNSTFEVFPNPAKQDFTITFPAETKHIVIFNSLGQIIFTKENQGKTSENINISAGGVYFIRINTSTGTLNKKLLIVK